MNRVVRFLRLWARAVFSEEIVTGHTDSHPEVSGERYSPPYEKAKAESTELAGQRIFYAACGHSASANALLSIYGTTLYSRIAADELEGSRTNRGLSVPEPCHACRLQSLIRRSARCALCGRGILPGEPATLYAPRLARLQQKDLSFFNGCVIGCVNPECCFEPAFFACGHWSEGYFVPEPVAGSSHSSPPG